MTAKLEIKYVYKFTVAVSINNEIYYIRHGHDFPLVYNKDLRKLNIPNIDNWLQAQTQQRYSYRGVLDMAEAYKCGLQFSYNEDRIISLLKKYYVIIRNIIFNSSHNQKYIDNYKIEIMNNKQLENMTQDVNNKYDQYVEKFGIPKLQAYLNRIYSCLKNRNINTQIIELLIKRTGINPKLEIVQFDDQEIIQHTIEKCVNLGIIQCLNIDESIIKNMMTIESTKK